MARKKRRKRPKFAIGEDVRILTGDDAAAMEGRTGTVVAIEYRPLKYLICLRRNPFSGIPIAIDSAETRHDVTLAGVEFWFEESDLMLNFGSPAWSEAEFPTV